MNTQHTDVENIGYDYNRVFRTMVLTLGCGCFGYASASTLGEARALSAVVGTDVIGRVKSGSLSIQKAKIKSAAKGTAVSKSTRDQIL